MPLSYMSIAHVSFGFTNAASTGICELLCLRNQEDVYTGQSSATGGFTVLGAWF